MRRDYEAIKSEIAAALGRVSKHYDMSEACFHLRSALSIVEHRERKESKRVMEREQPVPHRNQSPQITPLEAKAAISGIDKMIEAESRRLSGMSPGRGQGRDRTLID